MVRYFAQVAVLFFLREGSLSAWQLGDRTPSASTRRLLEYFEHGPVALFNVRTDLSESENLAERQPEEAVQLRRWLASWRDAIGAQLPEPNPAAGR